MPNKTIQESLLRATQRHRLVFWYDSDRGWLEEFEAFEAPGVEKLLVDGTEFGTKVRIARTAPPQQRFLIYLPSARPLQDSDNWLLDLVLQGHEFKADKASLAVHEAGLSHEHRELVAQHMEFFRSSKRTHALRDLLAPGDAEAVIRLKMMALLAGCDAELATLLLHFLRQAPRAAADASGPDPVAATLGPARLVEAFWKEVTRSFGYASANASLEGFAEFLFSAANPLDGTTPLRPDAKVFLQRWKDSQQHAPSFRAWSAILERRLHLATALQATGDWSAVGDSDTFEIFDKFVIQKLCEAFERGTAAADLRKVIHGRKNLFWRERHAHGYGALEHAVELRELLGAADLRVNSVEEGLSKYCAGWWRLDRAYRRCVWNLRCYNQTKVMEGVSGWVERNYVTHFLLPVAESWGDQVRQMRSWQSAQLRSQRRFFETYVQPLIDKGQTAFVVVSDALRYEAAADFAEQLATENRWSADTDAVLGVLPSYTQLGMAALLPGRQLEVAFESAQASVDGRSATGTANRAGIVSAACHGRGTALTDEEFRRMNSKTEGRDLMRDHDVIYIFHNKIDATGDKLASETDCFEAVQETFDDLREILKKIANINGSNMLLTADHGFLFQQDEVDDRDMLPYPTGGEVGYGQRRFVLSKAMPQPAGAKSFTATELGIGGDWTANFPMAIRRFRVQGSGKRFVHGGFSLQEVVVPVVRIRKARSDDTEPVQVDITRIPPRITTGQCSLVLLQRQPVAGKVLPRTLRVAVFAGDQQLSDARTITFDSPADEPRHREVTVVLTLAAAADRFNNRAVELRLDEETSPGSGRFATYRHQSVQLFKPFEKDFDD